MLSSIDNFVSMDGGTVECFSRAFSRAHLHRIKQFVGHTPALGRAFDLELISCQRMVDILIPPFIKLAQTLVSASRQEMPKDHFWFTLLSNLVEYWSNLVIWTLTNLQYSDKEEAAQPVIRPKKRDELLNALLEAKFPEVR